jgi:hypothetical protein
MRLKVISCEVFYREMCAVIARSPNRVDMEFLPKGLHDIGAKGMLERVQAVLDAQDETRYDTILFGYGLCNNGLNGLQARSLPVVIPKAHDCITLFLGSKERYREYFDSHPGVYFLTSGWIERGDISEDLHELTIEHQTGMDKTYEEFVEKYGEDNAKFLYAELCDTTRNYGQFTHIEMGVEPEGIFEAHTRQKAEERGWAFEKVQGDLSLIQRLVDGPWDAQDFVVLQPGERLKASYDEGVIAKEEIGQ